MEEPKTDQPTDGALDPAKIESERAVEQQEGITEERRGSPAAPSDKTEGTPPHPQDVNEMGR